MIIYGIVQENWQYQILGGWNELTYDDFYMLLMGLDWVNVLFYND